MTLCSLVGLLIPSARWNRSGQVQALSLSDVTSVRVEAWPLLSYSYRALSPALSPTPQPATEDKMLRATCSLLRTAAPRSATPATLTLRFTPSPRFYSATKDAPSPPPPAEGEATAASTAEADSKLAQVTKQLEDQNKLVAELKVSVLFAENIATTQVG